MPVKGLRVLDIDWNKKYGPGKFEACADARLAQVLYEYSLDGSSVDNENWFTANVDSGSWNGMIRSKTRKYYVEEDSNGFFTYMDITEEN